MPDYYDKFLPPPDKMYQWVTIRIGDRNIEPDLSAGWTPVPPERHGHPPINGRIIVGDSMLVEISRGNNV